MRIFFSISVCILFLFPAHSAFSQQPGFNRVLAKPTTSVEVFTSIMEDQQGYIWLTSFVGGLHRYNGTKFITYTHDPQNPKSIASDWTECLTRDSSNVIWVGTWGAGLERLDPVMNTFTHFRHNPKDKQSLLNDTISAILTDHAGNIWIGTYGGLELFNKKTGGFIHYPYTRGDTSGLSNNEIRVIYEDHSGTIWVGCGSPFSEDPETGGLNSFDKASGTFTHYMHDDNNPTSLTTNKIHAILEDSKGNFWVGTTGDGLHTMDRSTGVFTHYYYDAAYPEKLSRPPLNKEWTEDHITFIKEDSTGSIWIGSFYGGINRYDPAFKKITHYGNVLNGAKLVSRDTISGFTEFGTWHALVSRDGLLWVSVNQEAQKHNQASLYTINPFKTTIPYYTTNSSSNSFYLDPGNNILWVGTSKGLIRKELNNNTQKTFLHDPANSNSLPYSQINCIRADGEGNLWIGTLRGLCQLNTRLNTFTNYLHNEKVRGSLSGNEINSLLIDHNKNLWIATENSGIDKMDQDRGMFTNYNHIDNDSNSLSSTSVSCITEDQNHRLWIGTSYGLDRLDSDNKVFHHYLSAIQINSVFADASGVVWAGTDDNLYRFDSITNQFFPFRSPNLFESIKGVLDILEDEGKNLWISTTNDIIKINEERVDVKTYGENYGVHQNSFAYSDDFKSSNGEMFIGDQNGYYYFFPDRLNKGSSPPRINLTSFKIRDKEIVSLTSDAPALPVWRAKEIKLKYNENVFSFDFIALHYDSPGEVKYLFMLENYDNDWHDIGTEHKAYFINVPPGGYIFHVRAINGDGAWSEKNITVIITPPWYRTWWAYTLFAVLFVTAIWGFIAFRSKNLRKANKLLEEKVTTRTHQLQEEKEKVESTLSELKSTQAQLIQSEKMASLGELTAGIAHEIQNPLNFVNNFSEVNKELLVDMKSEIDKGNLDEAKSIANDVIDNQEKINHHGKRADAIEKGMLQHSRTSSGQKELTDINKLADEYLRLAYHGLRAKDKNFNADIKTEFDDSTGKINIVPQDIGRVILNLINNAFYSVSEKQKQNVPGYEPTVILATKQSGDRIEIKVGDNGNGVPQNVLDKIFQPFFTTKPTGEGTGLGLSLAYDIIKAHGGEIKVETKEGEGSEFKIVIQA